MSEKEKMIYSWLIEQKKAAEAAGAVQAVQMLNRVVKVAEVGFCDTISAKTLKIYLDKELYRRR